MNQILLEDIQSIRVIADSLGFKDKRIAVTGATGMIGRVLVEFLTTTTKDKNIFVGGRSVDKLEKVFHGRDFVLFNVEDLSALEGREIDFLIHLSSPTTSEFLTKKPVETIDSIYSTTKRLLDFCTRNNTKMIYASSMEVYGEVYDGASRKESELGYVSLTNPRSSYPEAKRLCELLCYSYSKEKDTDVVVARLAQTFGAGTDMDDPRVFCYFARCALNGEDILLKTEGKSYGNYTYLSDTISALLFLCQLGKPGETYNICGGVRATIFEMASLVADKFGGGLIKVIRQPNSMGSVFAKDTMLNMDNAKLRSLGWRPSFDLHGMYARMIESWGKAESRHEEN
jgi:nucleoside-diphosphate-sugar epimerase